MDVTYPWRIETVRPCAIPMARKANTDGAVCTLFAIFVTVSAAIVYRVKIMRSDGNVFGSTEEDQKVLKYRR